MAYLYPAAHYLQIYVFEKLIKGYKQEGSDLIQTPSTKFPEIQDVQDEGY